MKRKIQNVMVIAVLACMLLTAGSVNSDADIVMPYAETTKESPVAR